MNEQYLRDLHKYLRVDDDYATWFEETSSDVSKLRELHFSLDIDDDFDFWVSNTFGEVKKKEEASPSSDGESASNEPNLAQRSVKEQGNALDPFYGEAPISYDYLDYDFGDVDVDGLVSQTKKSLEDNMPNVYQSMLDSEDYKNDQKVVNSLTPGDKRVITPAGMLGEGTFANRPVEVGITEEYIEEEKDRVEKENFQKSYDDFTKGKLKQQLLDALPEDKRNDPEFIQALNDKLFFEEEIALDLDGTGRYNSQPLAEDILRGFYMGSMDMAGSLSYAMQSSFLDAEDNELLRAQKKQIMESMGSQMSAYEKGISASLANKDIYNATRQSLVGLAQTTPIIMATTAGGAMGTIPGFLSSGLVGLSGGVGAYMEVADDDEFGSDNYKYGYAVANGVGDLAFGLIGNTIMGSASRAAEAAFAGARSEAKVAGRWMTKEMLRGYAHRKGLAVTSEALEEAATEVSTLYIEMKAKGKKVDPGELLQAALDAAIIGGLAGGTFESIGNRQGQKRAMARARSEKVVNALQAELKRAEALEARIRDEKDPRTKAGLKKELARINAEIDSAAQQAMPFYDMLSVRHPEAFEKLRQLDLKIHSLRSQLKSDSLAEADKKSVEEAYEAAVRERVELQYSFEEESLTLTEGERNQVVEGRVLDAVSDLDSEIGVAEKSLEAVRVNGESRRNGADPEAIGIAEQRVRELKKKRQSVNKLLGQLQQARKEVESLAAKSTTEEADMTALEDAYKKLANVEEALNGALGIKSLTTQEGTAGELLARNREVQNRATEEWVNDAIERMENSDLTSEQLQEIFDSENFAMLTGENPNAQAVGEQANEAFNRRAEAFLKKLGLKYHKIVGRYGNGENSFLVEGMTREQAAQFAKEMGQESVAHKDGLVLADGSINLFEGGVSDASNSEDYFSAIKQSDGTVSKFGMVPSGVYQDAEGNTITEEEYKARIVELETSVDEIIEEATSQEQKEEAQAQDTTEQTEDKGVIAKKEYTPSSDGTYGVRAGDAGLSRAEAASVNNLMKLLNSVFGTDVNLVLFEDAASSAKEIGTDGGVYDGSTNTVYLSPERISLNMGLEAQERKKTFIETLNEEIVHGLIEPSFQKLTLEQQRDFLKKAKEIFKNDKEFLARLAEKRTVYKDQLQKPEHEVNAEEMAEMVSALAGDQGVQLGQVDRLRVLLNEMLVKVFGKKAAQFQLTDPNSMLKVAASLKAARSKPMKLDQKSTTSETKRSSAGLSPAALRPGPNGLVIKMGKTIYKRYGFGEKPKDIGAYETTKTFKDQWHFINWYKKVPKDDYYNFRTEDDKAIDVERINTYGRRSSASLAGPLGDIQNMNDRLQAAVDAGVVSELIANRMRFKFKTLERKVARMKETDPMYSRVLKTVEDIDRKSSEMIQQIAKRDGKEFSFQGDEPHVRSSAALITKVRNAGDTGFDETDFEALNKMFGGHFKGQAARNSLLSQFVRMHMGIDIEKYKKGNTYDYDAFAAEAVPAFTTLMSSSYASEQARQRVFGEKNPTEFFKNNSEATQRDLDAMEADGIFIDTREDNTIAYNIVKAIASQMNLAAPNMAAASNIFYASAQYRDRGGDLYIDPRIIFDLRNGTNSSGVDLDGITSTAAQDVARNLEDLNDLADKYRKGDGKVNFRKMHRDLGRFQGPKDSVIGRVYEAQTIFGPKIGTFALNLNGNEDAITLDSHNLKTLFVFSGLYLSPDKQFEKYRQRIADEVGMDPYVDSYDSEANQRRGAELLQALKEKMMRSTGDKQEFNRLRRLFQNSMAREVSSPDPGSSRRKFFETMIVELANSMNITPAQANQLVFADSQVSSHQIKELDPSQPRTFRTYQEFSQYSDKYTRQRAWKNNSLSRQEALSFVGRQAQNEIDALMDAIGAPVEPAPVAPEMAERRSSAQLTLGFKSGTDATDSPLYRVRSAEEGLTVKPGVMLTERMAREALATDATSRRIMAKDVEMTQGRQVGVRLNLNVNKNTGVPVQTMHDKNASGEALKYAPVVTVSNPVLEVNQNSRRKILTFQENKNPMASVNGGFLSDDIADADFNGVKAFFNPFKHNVFVDAQGRPIKSAEEATIVGNTVYLRGNIEYYEFNDPVLREGREETAEQRAKRIKRGPKYEKALKRYEAYAKRVLGIQYDSREELEASYDNMPITSQVALNESEVAANAEDAERRSSGLLRLRRYAANASKTYSGARSEILNNPDSYYSKQNLAEIKNRLVNMSDQELVDKMTDDALGRLQNRNDDIGVLAVSELIRRAAARGDNKAVTDLVAEAAKMGTTAGRILRHFRELRQATPMGLFAIIQSEIEKRGNKMTQPQAAKLKDMTERLFLLQGQHQDLINRAIQGEDVESEIEAKTKEVKAVEKELDTFSNSMIEKRWGEIGRQLIQGNLLTTMSQLANIGYNVSNLVAKVGSEVVAVPVERLFNLIGFESDYKRRYSLNAYLYGMRKFGAGFMEALDEVYTGQSKEVTEWRMSRGFMPVRSFMAAVGKGDLPITQEGETIPMSQRAKLIVQSTFGANAELMFRLLAIGDTPFRRMIEGVELYHSGVSQGLQGEALKNFINNPPRADQAKAEREGRKLTFQEATFASQAAEEGVRFMQRMLAAGFSWIPGTDGKSAAEMLVRSSVPYVRTPANMLLDTLTFISPYVAIPRIMLDLKNGDPRSASQNFGKIAVGTMAAQTARILIQEGLISGALGFDDEDEKRNLAYDQFPPNSINVTGLNRWIEGGDPSLQPDDQFMQYSKLGVVGAIIGAIEKTMGDGDEIPENLSGVVSDAIARSFGIGAFSSVAYMLDQSFLQGVNSLLSTLASSDADDFQNNFERWFNSSFQAASATVLPNQLSAFYRAEREFLPDVRVTKDMSSTERMATKMAYTVKDRTFGLGDVPVRINWKGEKIRQNPPGANPHIYQLFDVTKSRKGEADPVSNEMYRLVEQTGAYPRVVGTPGFATSRPLSVPDMSSKLKRFRKEFTFLKDEEFTKERLRLNTEQMNRLMEAAGKDRYMRIEELLASGKYQRMTDDEKLEALDDLNRKYYSKAISFDGRRLMPHSEELLNIIQNIYEDERREED